MDLELVEDIIEWLREYEFKIDIVKKGVLYNLYYNLQNPDKKYELEFYKVDEAGTLGLKIQWHYGKVVDLKATLFCLTLNCTLFKDSGPLFAGFLPMSDKSVDFMLVGQMIFSPNTPPEEVATLLFFNAFMNYLFLDINIPGVRLYPFKKD